MDACDSDAGVKEHFDRWEPLGNINSHAVGEDDGFPVEPVVA